jgi:putative hemolysin
MGGGWAACGGRAVRGGRAVGGAGGCWAAAGGAPTHGESSLIEMTTLKSLSPMPSGPSPRFTHSVIVGCCAVLRSPPALASPPAAAIPPPPPPPVGIIIPLASYCAPGGGRLEIREASPRRTVRS